MKISLGDLHDGMFFEEKKLKALLQHATTWKAVTVIDEADVFLEARKSGTGAGASRNGLVAGVWTPFTFLRVFLLTACLITRDMDLHALLFSLLEIPRVFLGHYIPHDKQSGRV